MDPRDVEPAEWLQVPTGSKRPSPSPSEGEADREIKKFRPQRSSDDEASEPPTDEFAFPFTDLPYEDFFGDQWEAISSNQNPNGMPFNTTSDFKTDIEEQSVPMASGNADYEINLPRVDNEIGTAALDVDPEAEINMWWRELSENPHQGSESHVDRDALNRASYSDQFGSSIAIDVNNHAWLDNVNVAMEQSEALTTDQNLSSEAREWASVGSMPIRGAEVHEPPRQISTISLPQETMDVGIKCDACFGVVGQVYLFGARISV